LGGGELKDRLSLGKLVPKDRGHFLGKGATMSENQDPSLPQPPNVPPPGDVPPPPPPQPAQPINYAASASKVPAYTGPEPTQDDKTMAMLCHLLAIITGFLGPLIIWLIKKDTSPFVDDQGKEALNFWISLSILMIICSITAFLCVPLIIALIAWIAGLIFAIQGAIRANNGVAYRYPFNIRMIK
jgi:uncharacterized Tic20 family protein